MPDDRDRPDDPDDRRDPLEAFVGRLIDGLGSLGEPGRGNDFLTGFGGLGGFGGGPQQDEDRDRGERPGATRPGAPTTTARTASASRA